MSERNDIEDRNVSAHYRALERPEPPESVDRAVLTQARDALKKHANKVVHTSPARRYAPFAIAATVLLSFGIVTQISRTPEFEAPVFDSDTQPVASGRAGALEDGALEGKLEQDEAQGQQDALDAPVEETRVDAQAVIAESIKGAAEEPAAKRSSVEPEGEVATGGSSHPGAPAPEPRSDQPAARARAAAPASAPVSDAELEKVSAAPTGDASMTGIDDKSDAGERQQRLSQAHAKAAPVPEQWLEQIQELWDSGDRDAARTEFERFLEMHPDYELPENFPLPEDKTD